jgi:hypothetical protein
MRAVTNWCVVLAVLAITASPVQAASYYVDSVSGNDANNGTSTSTPWKTLTKVNATTFAAGDYLLFKAGGSWTGQLNPKGSGASGNPIIIDLYDDPNAGKPIIDGNGVIGNGAVYLYNQKYWEINNLEVINNANSDGDRRGIYLGASNAGTIEHLYVRNCYIHNIRGKIGTSDGDTGAKRSGGIIVETIADVAPTRFNDILIENCEIAEVNQQGIALNNNAPSGNLDYPGTALWNRRKFTNVIIRNNSIHDVAKNAMIIRLTDETGLIEYNVCYRTANGMTGNTIFSRSCRGTVFQYNEGYLNNATGSDGSLYDADLQSPQCIFQYSYSHDNSDGLFTQCTEARDDNVIVRYNISRNDKGRIFCMNYANTSTYVYNNTVYIPSDLSPTIIDDKQATTKTYYFYNNIFYNMSPTATYNFLSGTTKTFSHNVFYNVFYDNPPSGEPDDNDDPNRLTSDPNLVNVNPVGDGNGLDAVDGYKLQAGSPCIDSGMNIANNGGFDYWGNEMPYNGITDRGFHEWPGTDPSSDTTAPRPNPMTFATVPHQTGPTSIAMTATTAVDINDVEYYFANTTIADHNSGWQASPTYADTGLMPSTSYTYTVKARDLSENLNETADSTPASATTAADTSPPLPNLMTWAIAPHQVNSNSISMTATTATDASGVEYYFVSIAGGGHDSGWQASSTYVDTDLSPGTYSYQVIARDTSLAHNTGGWSSEQFATIEVSVDTTPPSPSPMTFATAPYAASVTSVAMVATTATDASGVEYMFTCTAGGGHNSGWQDSTAYTDTGLQQGTAYSYTVKARDKSPNHNETLSSGVAVLNLKPVAQAGADQSFVVHYGGRASVVLDGSASCDPEGEPLSYLWAWNVAGEDFNSTNPNFTCELPPGTYTFTLIVNDGVWDSEPNTCTVTVIENQLPIAQACPDQTLYADHTRKATVTLDGSASSDLEGQPLTYLWSWNVAGVGCNSADQNFTTKLPVGIYLFSLVVNDSLDSSASDTCTVNVIAPMKAILMMVPKVLNAKAHHKDIAAIFTIPGITRADLDPAAPITLWPFGIQAKRKMVFMVGEGRRTYPTIIAFFDADEIVSASVRTSFVSVQVETKLKSGQYVVGSDFVVVFYPPRPDHDGDISIAPQYESGAKLRPGG